MFLRDFPAALVLDRKKLAAFSAAAGRFLRFPIGDRRCNRTRASVGNAGGNARPSLTNATLAASRLLHRRSPTYRRRKSAKVVLGCVLINSAHVRFAPKATEIPRCREMTRCANTRPCRECLLSAPLSERACPRDSLALDGFGNDDTGNARERHAFVFAPTGLPQPVVGFLLAVGLPLAGHDQEFH